ncbi:E3 ubiquitin-protein ligase WAVH1-like [Amaranthus tricolor]|uniref:E3 ubiquitin-protein ligase WAVH1-like n=1 Tax=Amaranthus tricolor TaxID=29722 RepID=UPI0025882AF1|nr:E3 ubiquitin-protein ligase WAVH1-like [Amaranthus tricolor]
MVQNYDDDERIDDVKEHVESGPDSDSFIAGKIKATYYNKKDAPLTKTNFKVLVELTGSEAGEDRPGVDIILVLDVSGSMKGEKLDHLKTATKFLVKKLSPIDRLSVIKFSKEGIRLCPLRVMTREARDNIEDVINELEAGGGTNITAGLEEALQVLNDRRFVKGREVAVMLMSDGNPYPHEADGSQVDVGNVPVYTFGLGQDYHPKVLQSIAKRSKGGTFSTADVENTETSNLSIAFAQCLAGLLSVVVQDLTLTITKQKSQINEVFAGTYPQSRDDSEGSVTISFGNLYSKEVRSILVDLVLDEVNKPKGTDVLEFTYSYKPPGGEKPYDAPPVFITVSRTGTPSEQENPEVLTEEARQHTAQKMKQAQVLADDKRFDDAKLTLNEAKTNLERNELDQSNPKIKSLQSEVNQFLKLMESPEIYEKLGRAFAFAAELSHSLQRFATRGDVNELRIFATASMDQFLEQVKKYEVNPEEPVPTLADDLKERIENDLMRDGVYGGDDHGYGNVQIDDGIVQFFRGVHGFFKSLLIKVVSLCNNN